MGVLPKENNKEEMIIISNSVRSFVLQMYARADWMEYVIYSRYYVSVSGNFGAGA